MDSRPAAPPLEPLGVPGFPPPDEPPPPSGDTVTVRLLTLAETTAARTAPKKTILLAAAGLKFVPASVTVLPTVAETGLKPAMTGTANNCGGGFVPPQLPKLPAA